MTASGRERWEPWALGFAMLLPTAAAWVYFVTFGNHPWLLRVYTGAKVVQFAFPVVWVALGRRERLFPPRPGRHAPLQGLGWGLAMATAIVGVYALFLSGSALGDAAGTRVAERLKTLGMDTPIRFALLAIFLSLAHSWLEEYYWRWFVFGRLRPLAGYRWALIASSVAFASHHVIVVDAFAGPAHRWTVTPLAALAVAGAGCVWAWLYGATGRLTSPWISHVCADLALMAVGYHLVWGATFP